MSAIEVVHDRCEDSPPVVDGTHTLFPTNRRLTGALVGNHIPSAAQGGKNEKVHQFFLRGVSVKLKIDR